MLHGNDHARFSVALMQARAGQEMGHTHYQGFLKSNIFTARFMTGENKFETLQVSGEWFYELWIFNELGINYCLSFTNSVPRLILLIISILKRQFAANQVVNKIDILL